ncbi:hypothetical protein ACFPPD_06145 [Cohnella suwonensis]|uniref:Uncharacterized protein n=1 Tax=Cohnella suwonensis TaxID=696072 RepID=A0ABW0LR47_9BACL
MGLLYSIYQSLQEGKEAEEEFGVSADGPEAISPPESLLELLTRPIAANAEESDKRRRPPANPAQRS